MPWTDTPASLTLRHMVRNSAAPYTYEFHRPSAPSATEMKPALLLLIPLFLLTACQSMAPTSAPGRAEPDPMRVMTFNIRLNVASDAENAWPHRQDMVASVIRFHGADIIGVQEAFKEMLDATQERLPGFAWTGVGRADGREGGEYSAIFYRTDRFELQHLDTFWLSETPEVPGSKSWDAAIERIVTWGRFRERATGRTFYVFNTHFDHIGVQARIESARLLVERIPAIAGDLPVILMGDFNVVDSTEPYRILTGDSGQLALHDAMHRSEHGHHGPTSTWNGFQEIVPERRIDFIFVDDAVRVLQHGILADHVDGRWPSDHLPVLAEITFD